MRMDKSSTLPPAATDEQTVAIRLWRWGNEVLKQGGSDRALSFLSVK